MKIFIISLEIEYMGERRNKIQIVSVFLSLAALGSFSLALSEYLNYENQWGVKIDNKLMTESSSKS